MTDILTRPLPLTPPSAATDWAAEARCSERIDELLVCTERIAVTHDVTTFVLQPEHPRSFHFQAGQYITVTVRVDGQQTNRCYTISSPPTRPEHLTITVKRVPGGPVSNWLHDHLSVGDSLPVVGPLGRFSTERHPASKYLFLSAGSGITPLMSMTRAIVDLGGPADVIFIHSARTPDDIIFRRELEAIATAHEGIDLVAICEQDSTSERWRGPRGRLSLPLLRTVAADLDEREIFTCGPPPYMAAVRVMLDEAEVAPARCHSETFTFEDLVRDTTPVPAANRSEPAGPPAGRATADVGTYSVQLRRSNTTVECDANTTVLQAARRAGVSLPSSCEEGVCGTCKSRLLSGTVDMHHGGGIRPREIAQNMILVCCSKPLEDLVVDA